MNVDAPSNPSLTSFTSSRAGRRRGMAMVMVMIALVVGAVVTLSFLSSQTTSTAIAHNATRQVQARAVAEDGMSLVIEHVRAADADWRDGYTHGVWTASTDLNGGSFRVMFEDDQDSDLGNDVAQPFVVTVEAAFNGVVHRISNRITPSQTAGLTVMLVTGNAYHANEDLERLAVIESWGYTVVTVTDSDPQAVYDAAAARADVIYISEESASDSVGTKFSGYDIGVVNEEQALQDEMKMSTSGGNYTGNTIDITDNTHPITAGFALGDLKITENNTGLIQASGTPASGLTTLAERVSSSASVLTVLDIGDTMTDGDPSPQRRVTLPFGSNAFEYGQLNNDGKKLMKQAIDWAAAGQAEAEAGLTAEWVTFTGSLANNSVDSLTWDDPVLVSVEPQVNFPVTTSSSFSAAGTVDRFGVRLTGKITIPRDGVWGFRLGCDDGAKLRIDGDLVVDHDGLHGFNYRESTASLTSGAHDFEVKFYEQTGGQGLIAYWKEPGSSDWEIIPESAFTTTGVPAAGEPDLVALYEFEEPDPVTPQLISHWKLDEAPSSGSQSAVRAGGKLTFYNNSRIDSYDASSGDYASQTPGQAAIVSTNQTGNKSVQAYSYATIQGNLLIGVGGDTRDDITDYTSGEFVSGDISTLTSSVDLDIPSPPDDSGSGGNTTYNGGTYTISEDQAFKKWTLNNNARVTIQGDVTIVVDNKLTLNHGSILVPTGSSLKLYVKKSIAINNASSINPDTSAPGRVLLSVYSNGSDITLNSSAVVSADVYVKDDLTLNNSASIYGSVTVGGAIKMHSSAAIHVDSGPSGGDGDAARDEIEVSEGVYQNGASGGFAGLGNGGTSAAFDGTDDFIEVPHDDVYLLDAGTVSLWVRPDSVSGTQGLIAKDAVNYGTGGHFRVFLSGSTLRCRLQSTSRSYEVSSSGGAVRANTWHHVAVGFGPGGLRMYLDGDLVDSDAYTGGLGTSSGGAGNKEPWAFGVDQWYSSELSSNGWDSPYRGRIDDVRIYDQNLNAAQAEDLYANTAPRAVQPAIVEDTSGESPALDLAIADPDNVTWLSDRGLTIDSATTISSNGTVDRLHAAITESDAISVEAVFIPANITQDGPARLFTYSDGNSNRNFQLGQTDAKYNVRLRTEFNTSGTPELESGDVLQPGIQEHVVFSYDAANEELRVYRNGSLALTETWTGDLDNWNAAYPLLVANEVGGSRPWLGTLKRLAIYDGAMNTIQAENLFNGNAPGDGTGGGALSYRVQWLESP